MILVKKKNKYVIKDVGEWIGFPINKDNLAILVYDQDMKNRYIRSFYEPILDRMLVRIARFVEEDGNNDDCALYLEQLEKELLAFLNRYGRFLTKSEINYYMKKIRSVANELKLSSLKKTISNVQTKSRTK